MDKYPWTLRERDLERLKKGPLNSQRTRGPPCRPALRRVRGV